MGTETSLEVTTSNTSSTSPAADPPSAQPVVVRRIFALVLVMGAVVLTAPARGSSDQDVVAEGDLQVAIVDTSWPTSISALAGGPASGIVRVQVHNPTPTPVGGALSVDVGSVRYTRPDVLVEAGRTRTLSLDVGLPVPSWGRHDVVAWFAGRSAQTDHLQIPWLLLGVAGLAGHLIVVAARNGLRRRLLARVTPPVESAPGAGHESPNQAGARSRRKWLTSGREGEGVRQHLLAEVEPIERHLSTGADGETAQRRVGDVGEGVGRRELQWELGAPDAGQVGRQNQEIWAVGERREGPGERERQGELGGGLVHLVDGEHGVLEGQHHTRVDLEGDEHVEGTAARLGGVEVDFPRLAHRVGLDEVPLVVHVKAVIGRVVLQIGDEGGDVDDGHTGSWVRTGRSHG